jgi:hypothetical protein
MSRILSTILTLWILTGCTPDALSWYTECSPTCGEWACTPAVRVMDVPSPPAGSIRCIRVKDMEWTCGHLHNGMTLKHPRAFLPANAVD